MQFPCHHQQPLEKRKNRQKKQNNEYFEWNVNEINSRILWLHFLSPQTSEESSKPAIQPTSRVSMNPPDFIFRTRKPPVSLSTTDTFPLDFQKKKLKIEIAWDETWSRMTFPLQFKWTEWRIATLPHLLQIQ